MWCLHLRVGFLSIVVLTFLLAAPASMGQEGPTPRLTLHVDPHGAAVHPTETIDIPLTVLLECRPPEGGPSLVPMRVALAATSDASWANTTVEPDHIDFADCPPTGEHAAQAVLTLRLQQAAPAGAQIPLAVTATSGDTEKELRWNETVGVHMNTTFRFEKTLWKAGPNDHVSLPLVIENHGNDRIEVSFQRADSSSVHLNVIPPPVQQVDAGARHVVVVDVKTPFENGYIEQRDELHLLANARAEHDEGAQVNETVTALIETEGAYLPAPGLAAVLSALALFASLRRRA